MLPSAASPQNLYVQHFKEQAEEEVLLLDSAEIGNFSKFENNLAANSASGGTLVKHLDVRVFFLLWSVTLGILYYCRTVRQRRPLHNVRIKGFNVGPSQTALD